MEKKFYVTTAIAYPNGPPHMGHALEIVQADVVARFHKLLGKDVFFQTGTDEHGTKNWDTAKKAGKSVKVFLDENVAVFKKLYADLNVDYDYFIRTTDKKIHHPGAIKLWKELVKSGDIYKKNYAGRYCVGCETFKTDKELEDNKCPNHPKLEIQNVEEENYFFRLSKYKDVLIKKIKSDEYKVVPKERKNEILSFLKGAKDISFSRPKSTLPWGIPVPEDEEHVMYVWCDALSNYITGAGYGRDEKKFKSLWPADVHIIGKDILRFHAAFWPAMLLSAKVALPKQLFSHGFILSKGAKMGKSSGNVIEPFSQIEKYGADRFRFYILGTMPIDSDGDYAEELLVERTNSEIVSNIANLFYRTLSFLNRNFDGKVIAAKDDKFTKPLEKKFSDIKKLYELFDFRKAINEILSVGAEGNKYFQDKAPWVLIKEDKKKAHEVLSLCVNLVKNLTVLLKPVMPSFASEIEKQLNLKDLSFSDLNFDLRNHRIGKEKIIFQKLEYAEEEEIKFSKLNLKVAEILDVKPHPNADKLFILKIDLGGKRQLVAGLKEYYKAEDLIGNKIVVVSNLEPAKLRGEKSEGMLLAAGDKKDVGLLLAENSKPGDSVLVEGAKPNSSQIKFDEFLEVKLKAENGKAFFDGKPLKTDSEEIRVDKGIKGKVC
ncbi:methionine--tRNA ligase [Bacteroidota bacterium]